jgi:hypothetical protein
MNRTGSLGHRFGRASHMVGMKGKPCATEAFNSRENVEVIASVQLAKPIDG